MELPVSGLHRLFHTGPTSSTLLRGRESVELDSVTEEAHTYDLLYPTLETLRSGQYYAPLGHVDSASVASSGNTFDECDVKVGDVRVLVAQDGSALSQGPEVLYDSQPVGPAIPGVARHGDVKPVMRSRALAGNFVSQRSDRDVSSPSVGEHDSINVKGMRESREETDALLGCMFGTTGLPLVSSTKIHINPPSSSSQEWKAGSITRSHEGSCRRSSPKKHVPLNRSMTSDGLHRVAGPSIYTNPLYGAEPANPSMLITRVFPVDVKSPVTVKSTEAIPSDGHKLQQGDLTEERKGKIKQVKIPRFAVSLVLRIPRTSQRHEAVSPSSGRTANGPCDDSNHLGTYPAVDLSTSATDYDVERITAHWNILTRVLSSLEEVARREIEQLLTTASEEGKPEMTKAFESNLASSSSNSWQKKPKQSSQRILQLHTFALQGSLSIALVAGQADHRISHAMKIRRVINGQGRWGVWREEARWVNAWVKGKKQDFFLSNLLTAFLGNHTDWLGHLGHAWSEQKRSQQDTREALPMRRRTVIISTDKMTTRRLIFLLSAFLPGTTIASHNDKLIRPLSSRSSSGLSQSPPIGAPLSREVSLRRTINRRPRGTITNSPMRSHERSVSFSTPDPPMNDDQLNQLPGPGHIRRASDARSIRSLALPIPLGNQHSRKSSITTDSTPVPHPDVPVPFFSNISFGMSGTSAAPRPGSSGSLASLSLQRTLSRSDSSAGAISPDSPTTSRWGSMLSGFWSARRGSSTEGTEGMSSSPDGLATSGISHSTSPRSPSKLARMVEEAAHRPSITGESDQDTLQGPPSPGTITEATPAKDIPERRSSEEFPLKLSIDTSDGVVDIDLPATRSSSASFTSSIDSPQLANTASSSFNDHSSLYGRTSTHSSQAPENDFSIDVAGYLRRYHTDFTLQAVHPYRQLKDEVKRSMHDESTSLAQTESIEKVDTCTTLVADMDSFSLSRFSLHRNDDGEEQLTEEPTMTPDPVLVEAVERVIDQGGKPLPARSRTTSPSHRRRAQSPLNIPHLECKQVILGALEEIVRSVAAEIEREGKSKADFNGNDGVWPMDNPLREGVRRWLGERTPR